MLKESFWIGLVAGLVSLALSLWVWGELPGRVPIHWGANGEPDGWASKPFGLLLTPAFSFFLPLMIAFFARLDPREENIKKSWPVLRWVVIAVAVFMVALHGFVLNAMGGDQQLRPGIVLALVGVLYAAIGNLLPKLKSNFMAGVRTPWSLSSERTWHKTQRVSGWAVTLAGLLTVALALLLHPTYAVWVIMPVLIVAPMVGVVYSYFEYQRETA